MTNGSSFKKWANPGHFFVYLRPFLVAKTITFSISTIYIEGSVDGLLGIRTWGRRMVSKNETTDGAMAVFVRALFDN